MKFFLLVFLVSTAVVAMDLAMDDNLNPLKAFFTYCRENYETLPECINGLIEQYPDAFPQVNPGSVPGLSVPFLNGPREKRSAQRRNRGFGFGGSSSSGGFSSSASSEENNSTSSNTTRGGGGRRFRNPFRNRRRRPRRF